MHNGSIHVIKSATNTLEEHDLNGNNLNAFLSAAVDSNDKNAISLLVMNLLENADKSTQNDDQRGRKKQEDSMNLTNCKQVCTQL